MKRPFANKRPIGPLSQSDEDDFFMSQDDFEDFKLGLKIFMDGASISPRGTASSIKSEIEGMDLDFGGFEVERVGVGISDPSADFSAFLELQPAIPANELDFVKTREQAEFIEDNLSTDVEVVGITVKSIQP